MNTLKQKYLGDFYQKYGRLPKDEKELSCFILFEIKGE